jgi:hypothetical protein
MDRSELKAYIRENAKKLGFDKVKKSWSDDDVRLQILQASGEKPAPIEKKKKAKSRKKSQPVKLNDQLREMGLWKKGMQFLSTAEKQVIINRKGKGAEAKKVYTSLANKFAKIERSTSASLKKAQKTRAKK